MCSIYWGLGGLLTQCFTETKAEKAQLEGGVGNGGESVKRQQGPPALAHLSDTKPLMVFLSPWWCGAQLLVKKSRHLTGVLPL